MVVKLIKPMIAKKKALFRFASKHVDGALETLDQVFLLKNISEFLFRKNLIKNSTEP